MVTIRAIAAAIINTPIPAIAAITGTGAITGATGVMTAAITVAIAGITAATAIDRPGGGDIQSSSWKPTFSVT